VLAAAFPGFGIGFLGVSLAFGLTEVGRSSNCGCSGSRPLRVRFWPAWLMLPRARIRTEGSSEGRGALICDRARNCTCV